MKLANKKRKPSPNIHTKYANKDKPVYVTVTANKDKPVYVTVTAKPNNARNNGQEMPCLFSIKVFLKKQQLLN